jgi:heme/copper-type cytochrome/quinol oxidase subunit 2
MERCPLLSNLISPFHHLGDSALEEDILFFCKTVSGVFLCRPRIRSWWKYRVMDMQYNNAAASFDFLYSILLTALIVEWISFGCIVYCQVNLRY